MARRATPRKTSVRASNRQRFKQLGPFRGVDNVSDETAFSYEPNSRSGSYLREAVNVDLTNDGWVRRRPGARKVLDFQQGHSGAVINGRLFAVDNGDLLSISVSGGSATAEVLASGLGNGSMSYALAGANIFCCNGTFAGCINPDDTWGPWGLVPPQPPVLTPSTGGLPAGRYMVALTSELDGLEGGSRVAVPIELTATGGIRVEGIYPDSQADAVNVYLTNTNGDQLFWAGRFDTPVAALEIATLPQSTDLLDRMNMWPPPERAHMVRLFKGRLLVAADKELYFSQPLAYHLFSKSTDLQQFPDRIKLLAPLDVDQGGGFFVGAGSTTWWVGGNDPDTWKPDPIDDSFLSEGEHVLVPGEVFPSLETSSMVVLWMTKDGVVAGLPGGQIRKLTDDVYAMDAFARFSMTYHEEKNVNQVVTSLRQKDHENAFGMSDRAFCDIVRAGS